MKLRLIRRKDGPIADNNTWDKEFGLVLQEWIECPFLGDPGSQGEPAGYGWQDVPLVKAEPEGCKHKDLGGDLYGTDNCWPNFKHCPLCGIKLSEVKP